jgi:hypothetical protein
MLSMTVVTDEPGRKITVATADNVLVRENTLYTDYRYYGQLNGGDWVELAGNVIPQEW